jgi:hypothetical protein
LDTPCREGVQSRTSPEPEPEAELTSRPTRFLCHECQIVYERDQSGLLHEVDTN